MARSTTRRLLAGAGTAAALLMGSTLSGMPEQTAYAQGTPSLLEFRWDTDRDYRKLYYYQTSNIDGDRSEWFLTLREKDRKTAILKLTVTVPDYFDSKLKPHRMRLCRTTVGGMMSRSKCLEEIPAVIKVTEDQTAIEVFPDTPLPSDADYSLSIKLFNPQGKRMYQFNALVQAPGDVPMSGYRGSWLIDVD
ncbi:DUF2808 domain-containing protein [Synechococcus sp. PROS-U-1]|jgi:hypothetical protein|uniref:DUF2808 domain-containing protein n=1 Tax=Synechococcus sp. PROS-U-1 TaxID=1400866 RepID=UPI0016450186|nr:DUF2808 domain-containing protein [Synechococcus sp. PROS-U-1]QNJ02348.1 uncharacterized conserved lipoprotein (DUF2808) [Synechococcus sp. PROS-U-1]